LFSIISGATYSGVPQKVQVLRPKPIFFAKPKSTWGWKNIKINVQSQPEDGKILNVQSQPEDGKILNVALCCYVFKEA